MKHLIGLSLLLLAACGTDTAAKNSGTTGSGSDATDTGAGSGSGSADTGRELDGSLGGTLTTWH
jgi:hypothetical protein